MRLVPVLLPVILACCLSPGGAKEWADDQVFDILARASRRTLGEIKTFSIERPVDTLRARLLKGDAQVVLGVPEALDVAAENSREFQRQKELLYQAALALTREQHAFATRFGGGAAATVDGTGDDVSQGLTLSEDLSASRNTESGGRIVASFVNTWFKDILNGGSWDPASLLNLSFTQPLLRGAGKRIAREPLTQAERDVIYQVRDFERFRATFAVRVVSDYLDVVQQAEDLDNEEENYQSVVRTSQQFEDEEIAGRRARVDVDRARQDELTADNGRIAARSRYESALDRFRVTLGLPTDAKVGLRLQELARLRALGVQRIAIAEDVAIRLALARRYDYRNIVDNVEDAARSIMVTEDALQSTLDFSTAVTVPTEEGKALKVDWERVRWSVGFDLGLALDRLLERNAYRTALINFEVALRAREQLEDQVKLEVREALRSIDRTYRSYEIQTAAVALAQRRVDSTTELNQAGRATALDLLDAKAALLAAQLQWTSALVDSTVARMTLLRDLEGLALEPKGLRFDPGLPLPVGPRPADPPLGEDEALADTLERDE